MDSFINRRNSYFIFFLLVLFSLISNESRAQKDDTLYFLNHDRISGEILQYKYGFLKYKTYGVGTVNVKYDKISTFYSKKSFDIIFKDGRRRFGSIDSSSVNQFVKIITLNDTLITPFIEIVEITPIKNKFWKRIDGSADLGFSYTRANTIAQLTFAFDVKYTHRNYLSQLKVNTLNTEQEEKVPIHRNDIVLSFYHRIKNDWFGVGVASAEQNSELGIDLRLQGIAGISNELIHTNSNNLMVGAGMVVNQEWSADTSFVRTNYDAMMSLSYRLFWFKDPEVDINTYIAFFPSFSVTDRYRINYDLKLKMEVINDFYIGLNFYLSYDNKPPSTTSVNLDYSITTSLGYTF